MTKNKLILTKTYDCCASGQPKLTVVFVHGIASDSSSFAGTLKYLEKLESLRDVRFVAFDLLGSGKSYAGEELEYNYTEQIDALHNSIEELSLTTPLILVGHSMGTFIVTRYASKYKKLVKQLILISPPIYTERDLEDPAFAAAVKIFRDAVSVKNREILEKKSFNNSMQNIVLDKNNYKTLAEVNIPTTLIYGDADKFIAVFNIPRLVKNTNHITAIRTVGHHGVSREKYTKLAKILEEALNDEVI